MKQYRDDFYLPMGHYLLSHSVGRMLKSAAEDFHQQFMVPWQQQNQEPWQHWLSGIDRFTSALASLLHTDARLFCPQTNLSSGLTKWAMSLPESGIRKVRVLMSEQDFPSMGFALQNALDNIEIVYIPEAMNMHDLSVWQQYIDEQIDWVFVSHVYSNSGQQAPVADIISLANQYGCRSIIDIAQSLSVLPINLSEWGADCVIGSCVKWSCGGPGAGFIWVSEDVLPYCEPKDVGWFSHQNPFEFDIHHFALSESALRFWGGTPSVAPYIYAGHSLGYFAELGIEQVRTYNFALLSELQAALPEFYRSPTAQSACSGTAILHFGSRHEAVMEQLKCAGIAVDNRRYGIRVSPHIYNSQEDISRLVQVINES
ncbi:aminotransferase [Pseudoalteromonas sp. GCY]|uniref:aminotransferase class V-fold PLP-dependent enzyme n=1 Tax=Pseudoalteromonas sp. GCY TaxID=2003316 RepID=UPI000BFEF415|nr:aminotransferase class V-fold PLP-dependent enzyme [Pseudoalteromonas sp. GCY]PHI35472.1 aminotransferase [Pseudoalteromonas sp. GCY]QQQ67299.1 aminotransferase class V-fold PLP-dependent enzyme [Pseudoalteromonas sp. GCY]